MPFAKSGFMFDRPEWPLAAPVRCAWQPYRHGTPAENVVRPWLAAALDTAPDRIALQRDVHGRPRLAAPFEGFDTSWSHSGNGLLMALGKGVRLGVDLEWLRPRPRALTLARRFFAAGEAATLATLPTAGREAAFVRLWCAKEAVLKAHGRGLSFGLHRLEFVARDGAWTLAACDAELGAPDDWNVQAFEPEPGYVAALAWRPL